METILPELLERPDAGGLPEVPWGGVAALMHSAGSEEPRHAAKGIVCRFGEPLCGLGLPVHVNGTHPMATLCQLASPQFLFYEVVAGSPSSHFPMVCSNIQMP